MKQAQAHNYDEPRGMQLEVNTLGRTSDAATASNGP